MRSESISVCLGIYLFNCKWLLKKYAGGHTGRPVKDLQKCLVGDGSAGLRGWKWEFSWREEFHKFPHQRLPWKRSDKDLKASIDVLKHGSSKLVRIEVSRPVDLEITGLNRLYRASDQVQRQRLARRPLRKMPKLRKLHNGVVI